MPKDLLEVKGDDAHGKQKGGPTGPTRVKREMLRFLLKSVRSTSWVPGAGGKKAHSPRGSAAQEARTSLPLRAVRRLPTLVLMT